MSYNSIVRKIQSIPGAVRIVRAAKWCVKAPANALRGRRAIACIERGRYDEGTYFDLYSVNSTGRFLSYLQRTHQADVDRIKNKMLHGGKVKIAFQVSCLAEWIGDAILDCFAADERFDTTLVIAWQNNTSHDEVTMLKKHFENRTDCRVLLSHDTSPGEYDIIFFTSPYLSSLENWGEREIPLSVLVCNIPYGINVAGLQSWQYNLFIHGIKWKNYCTSRMDIELAKKYSRVKDYGMVYSGYPKLDDAYDPECGKNAVWKTVGKEGKVKRIIYAPHHSIDSEPFYSTFQYNKDFFLQYAKDHAETTSWVFKPHPLLKIQAVKTGLFASEAAYNSYVDEWRNLPNASVQEGQYLPYFASSDALILDSGSFMAEYLYFHKPLLFLTRKGERFSELGEIIIKTLYTTPGNDEKGILRFIEQTMNEDPKRELRESAYQEYLNIYSSSGMLAYQYIYSDITNSLFR